MSETSCRRCCAAVCLLGAFLLIPGSALASPVETGRGRIANPSSVVSRFWNLLSNLWQEEGCRLDPDGATRTLSPEPASPDAGCLIDPDGRCIANQ